MRAGRRSAGRRCPRVGAGEVAVTTPDAAVTERKVPLPERSTSRLVTAARRLAR